MRTSVTRLLAPALTLSAAVACSPAAPPRVTLVTVDAGGFERVDTPLPVSLEGLAVESGGPALALYEVTGGERVLMPSQVEPGPVPRLWWILTGTTPAGATRTFELAPAPETEHPEGPGIAVEDDGDSLTLVQGGRRVLRYRYTEVPPPPGTSPLYARGGFIHPLWSPEGEVLTRIQPEDHYHHVGLWNPWTHTEFEGRVIDFWNLAKGEGTVRFKKLLSTTADQVWGGFRAAHEHVDLKAPGGKKVALEEEWDVRAFNLAPATGVWLVDFATTQRCASPSPLTVKEYRYQGFGFRATAAWGDETSTIRTSEGKDKSNGNFTRARWIDVRGVSAGGTAGILFMSHPGNFNHPEPLRIWPTGQEGGEGNVFVNFNPAQDRDWVLEPDRDYTLRYRMLVYDGAVEPDRAEGYWTDYAHPPMVTRE